VKKNYLDGFNQLDYWTARNHMIMYAESHLPAGARRQLEVPFRHSRRLLRQHAAAGDSYVFNIRQDSFES
jgi:hypothetical protein